MKGKFILLLAVVLSACLVTSAYSATWTKIGSSGLTSSAALMQDRWRPVFNSIAVDHSGNVYVTANNGNNRGLAGGVTIFKTDSSVVNVNVNALGLKGGITELKTGGDGKVYGIQNWKQLWQWAYSGGELNGRQYAPEGIPERILRFNLDGTVDTIAEVQPVGGVWQVQGTTGNETVTDLGGGNWGVLQKDTGANYRNFWRWVGDREQTAAARFRVDVVTIDATQTDDVFQLSAKTDSLGAPNAIPVSSPTPAVAMKLVDGVPHFVITKWNNLAVTIQDLGAVTIGAWYEAYLYVNADPANPTVKLMFGPEGSVTEVYNASWLGDANLRGGTGYAELGASSGQTLAGSDTRIMFDWIGFGKGYQTSKAALDNVCDCGYSPADFNYGRLLPTNPCTTPYNGWAELEDYLHYLSGIEAGSDGNIYFTASPLHRTKFFFRYNVSTGVIEEAPSDFDWNLTYNCGGTPPVILDPNPRYGLPVVNNGWNTADGMFQLVRCGTGPRLVGPGGTTEDVFAVCRTGGTSAFGADPMQWDFQRDFAGIWNGSSYLNLIDAGWGRMAHIAPAWDPIRNKLWLAPWSEPPSAYWNIYRLNQAGTWGLVDFPGEPGNKGITMGKTVPTSGTYSSYCYNANSQYTDAGLPVKNPTIGARLVVTAFNGAYNCWFLMASPAIASGQFGGRPVVGVVDVGGGVEKWVWGVQKNKSIYVQFGVLGDFALNVPHTCFIYAEATAAGVPRKVVCYWDGARYEQAMGDADPGTSTNTDPQAISTLMTFGATGRDDIGGVPGTAVGTCTVIFDWVKMGRGELSSANPDTAFDFRLDGTVAPHLYMRRTNVMSVFTGTYGNTCLWDIDPSKPYPTCCAGRTGCTSPNPNNQVGAVNNWHQNGKGADLMDTVRDYGQEWWRGGNYWATGLAINPSDGSAWMGWGADPYYNQPDLGHVIARDIGNNLYDEGLPEAGAQIAAVAYKSGKMYALAFNLTTGVYSLYSTDVPGSLGSQSASAMKGDRAGSLVQTDVPKVVTYVDTIGSESFFYIEDADRGGGMRVSQPASLPAVGDKVGVSGLLNVANGEAVITYPVVTLDSSGNPDVKPLGTTVRGTGGTKLGPQPATNPAYGLNNVGLLVRIAGKVAAIPTDDCWAVLGGGRNWFTIDDGTGATTRYMDISDPPVQRTIPGIKVLFDPGWAGVAVGDMVEVTGVVGVDFTYSYAATGSTPAVTFNASGQRIIFCRTADDIYKYP